MTIAVNSFAYGQHLGFDAGSYVHGAATAFNILGQTMQFYNAAETAEEADAIAVANDWAAVRGDFARALDEVAAQLIRGR